MHCIVPSTPMPEAEASGSAQCLMTAVLLRWLAMLLLVLLGPSVLPDLWKISTIQLTNLCKGENSAWNGQQIANVMITKSSSSWLFHDDNVK